MKITYDNVCEQTSKLLDKLIDKDEFLEDFCNGDSISNVLEKYFEIAISKKDSLTIEYLTDLLWLFEVKSEGLLKILNELLIMDWHIKHEDIAFSYLGDYHSETSIEYLYKAANMNLEYLDFGEDDDAVAFPRKCVWELYKIGTSAAKEKLELLADHKNLHIAVKAQKRLREWKKNTSPPTSDQNMELKYLNPVYEYIKDFMEIHKEYAETPKVEKIFVYMAREGIVADVDYFVKVGENFLREDMYYLPYEKSTNFTTILMNFLYELEKLSVADNFKMPTEIKIIYDCNLDTFDINILYEPQLCEEYRFPYQIFQKWLGGT
jgi:hypothetical protein